MIVTQTSEYTHRAFRAGHAGMADFNRLLPVLRTLPAVEDEQWMDLIDEMRETHDGCLPCSCKVLAYSFLITRDILPERSAQYRRLCDQAITLRPMPEGRNYLAEVIWSLQDAPEGPEARIDKLGWQRAHEEVLLSQVTGGSSFQTTPPSPSCLRG